MKNAKTNLLLIALSSLTVLALAGSSLGTLAWYAYSVRVTTEFSGTAVNETEQLQIGLLWNGVSPEKRTTYSTDEYSDMTFEAVAPSSPNYYWFMPAGKGFTAKEVSAYLEENGYTTNKLQPVTTREYKTGNSLYNDKGTADTSDDKIELYQAPSATYVITDTYATKDQYVYLPFAFRIISYSSGTVRSYAKKGNIWLTDVTTAVSGSRIADRSLRIHVDNLANSSLRVTGAETSFNLNPKAEHVEGKDYNYVAGLLDLKKSGGFYDTDALNRELIYGDITIEDRSTLYNDSVMKDYKAFDATTELTDADSNINGVTRDEVYRGDSGTSEDTNTTFLARHREGTFGFTSFLNVEGNDIRKKAEYMCLSQIKPTKNSAGDWEGGSPITTTADDDTGIGRCDMYIYLEGWDHSIVDSQIDTAFSLGLQFEINRV